MSTKIGTTHTGKVVRKADFGVFVGIEGARNTGLVHVSRLRGNSQDLRNQRLAEIKVGDEIVVEIVDIEKTEQLLRISLSEKKVHEELVLHNIPIDEVIPGVVTSKVEYGAFVLLPGWYVSGLLHVSRMTGDSSRAQSNNLAALEIGDEVDVLVTEIGINDNILKLKLSQA